MTGAGILHGDLAVCRPRQYAQDGEIVVALIRQEEATVKRFYRRSDHIELRPENSDYRPMRYDFDDVLVQGKVVGGGPGGRIFHEIFYVNSLKQLEPVIQSCFVTINCWPGCIKIFTLRAREIFG